MRTSTLSLVLALAATGLAAPALARDKEPKAPASKYTPAIANGYNAAKKALDAGDTAGATAQYQTLKGQVQTDDDKLVVGQLGVNIGQKTSNDAMTAEAITLMLSSNKVPDDKKGQLYAVRGQIAYQAKDFRTAADSLALAQQGGYQNDQLVPMLVQSIQNTGDTLKAMQTLSAAIDANTQAGKPTPSEWYQRGFSIGYQASQKATGAEAAQIADATSAITQKWVAAYPTKANWHDALQIYSSQYKAPTDVQVDLFRLMRAAGALNSDADYREYAEDVYLRYPNEAKTVLEEGNSKGIVNLTGKNDATEVLTIVKGKVAADKASLPAAEKSARVAANGKSAQSTADAYAGYGDWAKAAELYKVAIDKGGVDVPTATLRMGWAQAMAGDTAAAKTSFNAVTGIRKPLAQFWLVHLDHPTQG
jgi:hypothetical protein